MQLETELEAKVLEAEELQNRLAEAETDAENLRTIVTDLRRKVKEVDGTRATREAQVKLKGRRDLIE